MTDDTTPAAPPADEPNDGFCTKDEAAQRLGISTRQLDRLVSAGALTKYRRTVGRQHVQYKINDLDALLVPAVEND